MAQVGTAVPGNVNLSRQKPYAVSAYSRRVKSLANNAQAFGPDSYINITLDTSTPGSFLDPLQSYLKFDLQIQNSNPFNDFVSFGAAGAASLIEEFRIYVQGTPIEEILQYNVFYELAMNQNGQCQQPFNLFKSNPANGQGVAAVFSQSAIKPPMVDFDGRPMYGTVVHAPSSSVSNGRSVSWAFPTPAQIGGASDRFLNAKIVGSQSTMHQTICFSGCRPYYTSVPASKTTLVADAHALLMGGSSTLFTDANAALGDTTAGITNVAASANIFPAGTRDPTTGLYSNNILTSPKVNGLLNKLSPSVGQVGMNAYQGHYTCADASNAAFANYLATDGGILPYAGTTVEFPSLFGLAGDLNPDLDPHNPLNWCSFIPSSDIRPDTKTLGPDNLQDYFMFLANTKFIPVGVQGWDKADAAAYDTVKTPPGQQTFSSNNFRNLRALPNGGSTFTYTCCIPLISGVLGSFAEKCWPTMLIAPGSMYIQIRTATAQKAFQLSMDPCRRVLGTIRDYLPFGGSIGGVFGQCGGNAELIALDGNLATNSALYNATFTGAAINGLPFGVGHLPRDTFSEYTGPQNFVPTATGVSVRKNPVKIHSYINGYACIGATLASANQSLSQKYLQDAGGGYTGAGVGLMFRPYGVAAMEGRWTIGKAYVSQSAGTTVKNLFPTTEEGGVILPFATATGLPAFGTNLTPNQSLDSSLGTGIALRSPIASAHSVGAFANNFVGGDVAPVLTTTDVKVELSPAGIPLPQYWLHAAPWSMKEFFVGYDAATKQYTFTGIPQVGVAHEALACYGTFLSASVPQCRRVFTNRYDGLTTYLLQNIEFVSQQIILPDSVSASILEDAAQGDISITANSLHNYQTPIAQSNSQNLIIPAKIASANTMYCLFVPQSFVSGDEAFCYNSLRGVCPFGSVSINNGLVRNGLTSAYNRIDGKLGYEAGRISLTNIPCSSGLFQVQMKVGNELIPQQPLTSIAELVTENVKAQHKLFDTSSNVNATYALTTKVSSIFGQNTNYGLAYDVLKSGSFTTAFVSAELCDDQTAINNPAMTWVYACEANYIQSTTNTAQKGLNDYVIRREPYGFELFQPPESSFVLAFDMDTWSRVSDVTRSGKYLGNNTITLNLNNAIALGVSPNDSGSNGYTMQTFVVHDIRFSFQAGGSVVSYY